MKLSDFTYSLPPKLIAQKPLHERTDSRLMVMERHPFRIDHSTFSRISDHIPPRSILVINDTKVIPARLLGKKPTGGKVELLLTEPIGQSDDRQPAWKALAQASKPFKTGMEITFPGTPVRGVLREIGEDGFVAVTFSGTDDFDDWLEKHGLTPLPPYIHRPDQTSTKEDRIRYQTVYASCAGAVAAPTAGLHFTTELMECLASKGVTIANLTLHVGPGTFLPVRCEDVREHRMHEERFSISEATANTINQGKKEGRPVIAVGTTTVRALESATDENGIVRATEGKTTLFIYPGYRYRLIDHMITNFHLPGSTLLMMVSAFASRESILNAYRVAIDSQYRFYSYGDAMLIL